MGYALRFRALWIFLLLVLPLALLAATVPIVVVLARRFGAAPPDEDVRLALGIAGAVGVFALVTTVVWCAGTRCYGLLVRSRAVTPLPLCLDPLGVRSFSSADALQRYLRSRAELREHAGERNAMLRADSYVTPVSGGWSFFLSKKAVEGPCVVLDGLRGPCDRRRGDAEGSRRFYSGTHIGEMLRTLAKDGLTLASTPSHDTITLGGWVGGCAHGSGGSLWQPTIGRVRILDQQTGEAHDLSSQDQKRYFGMRRSTTGPQYVLTEIEVLPVEDVWTQLAVRRMTSEDESKWWLTEESYLRCIFTGKRGSMLMLWIRTQPPRPWRACAKNEHVDPHCCSRECRYFQADLLSALQRRLEASAEWFEWPTEPRENWDGKTRLSNANRFSPTISALAMAIATFYTNFEVFVRLSEAELTANVLTILLNKLQDYHTRRGGRTEIRFGVYKGAGKLFVDFGVPNNNATVSDGLAVLADVFGRSTKMAFHPGKTIPPSDLASRHLDNVVGVGDL